MDKEKAIMLQKDLQQYKEMQEKDNVTAIGFYTDDGQNHRIDNPETVRQLVSTAVIGLERGLRTALFGDIPERLEHSREYKAVKALEDALNNGAFNPQRFAESIRYMHPTLQQTFFRAVKASILFMADRKNLYIDGRNEASHEMCRDLAGFVMDVYLPYI